MRIEFVAADPARALKGGAVAVMAFEGGKFSTAAEDMDKATDGAVTRAIAAGFNQGRIAEGDAALLADARMGEALLGAIDGITDGVRGDLTDVSDALALLRHLGLESAARRIALELMLLERRG